MNGKSLVLFGVCAGLILATIAPVSAQQEVRLSRTDCLVEALKNNLDLVQARKDPEIAEENVRAREGAFDLVFDLAPLVNEFKREKRTPFETAGKGRKYEVTAGLESRPRIGGFARAEIVTSAERGANVQFSPFYQTGLQFTYQLPLRRNFGKEPTMELVLQAQGNLEMSREEFRRQVHAKLLEVENAYWDLVASRKALRVAEHSLERANDLLKLNRKKVEVGTLAPIEITQAQAGVADQEEGVIVAEANLENAEDELRRLLAKPPEDPIWSHRVVPTDEPSLAAPALDLDAAIETAFASRPEFSSTRADLRNKELAERVTRNRLKHGLDLEVFANPFGNNNDGQALDSSGDPIIIGFESSGAPIFLFDEAEIGKGLTEAFEAGNYFWQTKVTYSVPIGNRAAKANHRTATLDREKTEVGLRSLEQNIRVEVRTAVRAVESGGKRVGAARENVRLQREKLDAEQKKFANGMSTSFQVLTFQDDLANAELREIRALADYNKSLASLENAKGTFLEARGLSLE